MPYFAKNKCVYKKNTGKKVGCTKGPVKNYLAALHANVEESLNECWELKNTVMTDDKSEASVFFNLTKAPGVEIGLVFSMPDADYQFGIIRDLNTKQLQKFEDPQKASKLLKSYGVTPQDVENEMYQQAYEQIEKQSGEDKVDDGVRIESLQFEALFTRIFSY